MLTIFFNVFLLVTVPAVIMGDLVQVLPQEVLGQSANVLVTGPNPLAYLAVLLYPVEAFIVMLRPNVLLFPFNEKEKPGMDTA
jgi:hypothetical protein